MSPLQKDRKEAMKGPKYYFILTSSNLILTFGGWMIIGDSQPIIMDFVRYLITVAVYWWIFVSLKKYWAYAVT
jgi:hypothetical protein